MNKRYAHVIKVCECAILVALAIILDLLCKVVFGYLEAFWPLGGSITLGMVPLVFISYRHGTLWGFLSAFVYSGLQIVTGGFGGLPTSALAVILCLLLDYIIAYSVIGIADIFAKPIKVKLVGYGVGAFVVCALRFVCSFLSGVVVWGDIVDGASWAYSFTYNISYMLPSAIVTTVVIVAICAIFDPKTLKRRKKA